MSNQIQIHFTIIFTSLSITCLAQICNLKAYKSSGNWGVINSNRTIILPCEYDELYVIKHKTIIASKSDSIYIFNKDLKLLHKEKSHFFGECTNEFNIRDTYIMLFGDITNELFYAQFIKNDSIDKLLFISEGKLLDANLKFEKLENFNLKPNNNFIKVIQENKYGIADTFGNIIIEPQYQNISSLHQGILFS